MNYLSISIYVLLLILLILSLLLFFKLYSKIKSSDKSSLNLIEFPKETSSKIENFIKENKKSNEELINYLREQKIDIAVDLKGFCSENKFFLFANRIAPIQVSYLGYP